MPARSRTETATTAPHERRQIFVHFVRHGEPAEYGKRDASLSEKGREDVRGFARHLTQLVQERGRPTTIKVQYSGWIRTRESAEECHAALEKAIRQSKLSAHLVTARSRPVLEGTGTIGPIIEAGVPKPDAFQHWLETDEGNEGHTKRTPKQVFDSIVGLVGKLNRLSARIGPGPDLHYVFLTHETHVGAIAKHLFGIKQLRVGYAEPLSVQIGAPDGSVTYSFRGTQKTV